LALFAPNFDLAKEKNPLKAGCAISPLDKIDLHPGHCYLRAKNVYGTSTLRTLGRQAMIVNRISFFYQF